ncbi:MAG TPA: hypothetical protein VK348_01795 [Planctomycetota bacterium]|nr:hypothetical protein [Planctomycetota bacterium]
MSKKSTLTRSAPSKEQAKAWLATVLGPLARGVEVEAEVIAENDWSFRVHSRDFEFLLPTQVMVDRVYHANLEQFWRFNREMKLLSEQHDKALDGLRQSAARAFDRLMDSRKFLELTREAGPMQQYLAQCIVNSKGHLPSFYEYSRFWNEHRDELMALRKETTLQECFRALQAAGVPFQTTVDELLKRLFRAQQEVADKFGLPPVEPLT